MDISRKIVDGLLMKSNREIGETIGSIHTMGKQKHCQNGQESMELTEKLYLTEWINLAGILKKH